MADLNSLFKETRPVHKVEIDRYSRAVPKIELAIEKLTESKLKWKPNPKKWSIREIIMHLADIEPLVTSRVHLIVTSSPDSPPTLPMVAQDTLAERYEYNSQDELLALQSMKYLRKHTTELLKALPDSEFLKHGIHAKQGKMTITDVIRHATDHIETHLKQIELLKEELAGYER